MLDRFLSRGRSRSLARKLAGDPTAANYLALAQSHASSGQLQNVARVCEEGLELHPGNLALQRLKDRAVALRREDRVCELQKQLKASPRPAIFKELCEAQLAAGRLARAEKVAVEWYEATKDSRARLQQAVVRSERYFADRRRDDARVALGLLVEFLKELPRDPQALRLSLEIYSRCGAWLEARKTLARLLEVHPGDPSLEARYRTVASLQEKAPTLDQALREVERTGHFVDDDGESERGDAVLAIRPVLQKIAEQAEVLGAFYVRGGTALVQGPSGASAERYARGVREMVVNTRNGARRLGLGVPIEVQIEGEFGSLCIRPGAMGAGAIWSKGSPAVETAEALSLLVGEEAKTQGGEA